MTIPSASDGHPSWAPRALYGNKWLLRSSVESLLIRAELQYEADVLDVATGLGHTAVSAALYGGAEVRVLGIDSTEDVLSQARLNAKNAGVNNVEFRTGDIEHLEFPDHSFDRVLCTSAILFLASPVDVLKEWLRVVKPGGSVIFTTFDDRNFQSVWPELALADGDQCGSLLRDAGLSVLRYSVSTFMHNFYFLTAEHYWENLVNCVPNPLLIPLRFDNLARLREAHFTTFRVQSASGEIIARMAINVCVGCKE